MAMISLPAGVYRYKKDYPGTSMRGSILIVTKDGYHALKTNSRSKNEFNDSWFPHGVELISFSEYYKKLI